MSNSDTKTEDTLGSLWTERYRPKTLKDIVLSKEDREFFETLSVKQEIPHLLFAGTPGVGKTTTAQVIVRDILKCDYQYINASDESGIDTIRGKIIGFAMTKSFDGKMKVVLLDEVDGLSGDAMKCLRNTLEEYAANTRFVLTCNYLFKIIPALQSRCIILNLVPPAEGVVQRVIEIFKKENIIVPPEQKPLLLEHIRKCLPDVRRVINDIQKFSISGTLRVRNELSSEFAEKLFQMVRNKVDLTKIRKFVIDNEKQFSNDYRHLLGGLFECVFLSDLEPTTKADCMLVISDSLNSNVIVVDKEIDAFAALIRLSRLV